MRYFLLGAAALLGALYALSSVELYRQERWAQAAGEIDLDSPPPLEHPGALLDVLREAFAAENFSDSLLPYLRRSLAAAPSSYRATFLLAAYHANRLEAPELVRRSFEASVKRYPANGRLHLAYARWLLESNGGKPLRSELQALAERHLGMALALESDLTRDGLELLQGSDITPDRWMDLVPKTGEARRELLAAYAMAGHREKALALLRELEASSSEESFLRQAAAWALEWGDPELALDAARRWQGQERSQEPIGSEFAAASLQVAKALLQRGEPGEAYQSFREALKELEARMGSSSSLALELRCGMGYEYLGRGQRVMAESLFAEAMEAAPYYAPALLGLARAYRAGGDRASASEQYRKLLKLHPESSDAARELMQLMMEADTGGSAR